MGLLTGIKALLAAPKIAGDVFDKDNGLLAKAGGFIGGLHYSEQEKAKGFADLAKAVSDHVKTTLGESTERSRTRRTLAVMWVKVQLALILMVAITIPLNKAIAKQYFDLATCEIMFWGTGSVIVFFFGAYVWGTYIKKG